MLVPETKSKFNLGDTAFFIYDKLTRYPDACRRECCEKETYKKVVGKVVIDGIMFRLNEGTLDYDKTGSRFTYSVLNEFIAAGAKEDELFKTEEEAVSRLVE